MPPRICIVCSRHAIPGTSRCEVHSRGWRKTPAMQSRSGYYKSASWRERSRRQLAEFPTCAHCGAKASIADHIFNIGAGGDPDGPLQSLCLKCHRTKTASEGGRAAKAKRQR